MNPALQALLRSGAINDAQARALVAWGGDLDMTAPMVGHRRGEAPRRRPAPRGGDTVPNLSRVAAKRRVAKVRDALGARHADCIWYWVAYHVVRLGETLETLAGRRGVPLPHLQRYLLEAATDIVRIYQMEG